MQLLVIGLAGALHAQTLTDIGSAPPTPGANDISQLSTSGNKTSPDGLNYYTDNNPPVGQTFTTGSNAMKLVSVAIKTAGLNSGGGYGTPATTPTYYLRIYSMSGSTATLLITFSAANPGFSDGDWLLWSGLNVPLEANKTYAFSFARQTGGYAAMAVATNAYAGGEIALIPINGGAITTGGSHSYDAAFALGLQPNTALPMPTYGWNLGNTLEPPDGEGTWGPAATQSLINAVADAGFNTVRLPVAWNSHANQSTYQIDAAWLARVKQVVDWCYARNLTVIVNSHWDGGWLERNITDTVDPIINAKMQSYWTQIATTFAGYDSRLLFAGTNEPDAETASQWTTLLAYHQTFVNAVRATGANNSNRWLVIQGPRTDIDLTDQLMNTLPSDSASGRLAVEVHYYSPVQFCIMNADEWWGNMFYFWGQAYHHATRTDRNANAYEDASVDAQFQKMANKFVSRSIPVIIGEFSAMKRTGQSDLTGTDLNLHLASRTYFHKYVVDSAQSKGLMPIYWDIAGVMFDWSTGAITDNDNVRALTGGTALPPPNGAPYPASGLTATSGTGQVSLSWTAGSGATSYSIYRAAECGYESGIPPIATGITGTSYLDTGLNAGTTYYYQVVAVNGSGPSGFSPEAHAATPGVNPDPAQYNFETDTQRWWTSDDQIDSVATSTAQHFAGNRSLAVNFSGTAAAGISSVNVNDVAVAAGTTVTFHVWIPSGSPITIVEPYFQDYNWAWNETWYNTLTSNAWNTFTVTVPSTTPTPLRQLGIRFTTSAPWSGTCYIDSVTWPVLSTPPAAPTNLAVAGGNAGATLSWSASVTATYYSIKRSTTSGSGYTTIAYSGSLSFTDTNLVNGTTYYYVVSAINEVGESANSAEVSVKPSELRARYAFEGNAQDSSGNGFHGTATAVTYVSGRIGAQAAQFNGTSSYVSIPPPVTDDFTVAMWVKTTDTSGTAGDQWWNGKGLVDGEVWGAGADWGTSIVNGKFVLGVGAASGDITLASSVNINDGAWHHVAATRNNTSGAMAVYVDGVLRGSGTGPTGSRTLPTILRIGGLQPGANFLNGTLDDVRLYGRIMTAGEIAALTGIVPTAPAGVSAVQTSAGQATISWLASDTATSFTVKRSGASGGPYTIIATNVTATTYLDPVLSVGTPYYYVISGLNAAGVSPNSSEVALTLVSTTTVTLNSAGGNQDGYVRASNNANTAGGFISTNNTSRLGDDSSNRQYKAILSFNTSSIPRNAVITSGTLMFKRSGLTGTNMFTTGTGYADIKGGTGFNGSTTLETGDFQAAADATQVATMSYPASNGSLSSAALNAAGLGFINKTGTTQFRVYLSPATNSNNANDYVSWYTGSDATASNRPALQVTYFLQPASTSPVAYLKFDETSGTTAVDSSGHGWHGTLVNGPTWVAGKANNAVSLSGSAYVTLPTGVVNTLSDFTISAWVKLNSVSTWSRIFDFGTGTGVYMFLTPQNGVNGRVRYTILTSGSSEQQIDGTAPLTSGTWTHVAVTLSGSTGTLYVNGTAVGTNTAMTFKPSSLGNTTQNYIGKSQFSADPYLNGLVDEFQIYNRALSASEISVLAAGQLATPQNVTATPGNAQISLSWSAVNGATDYTIQRASSISGAYTNLATGVSGTNYVNSALGNGATWFYTVAANGLPGLGAASSPVSATTYTAVQNWRFTYFNTISNSGSAADSADPDGDGMTNAQEFTAGTNPTSAASVLKISQMQANGNDMLISFPTVSGKTYRVERSDTLQSGSWVTVQSNIAGSGSTVQVTDSGGAAQPKRFYRVVVQ